MSLSADTQNMMRRMLRLKKGDNPRGENPTQGLQHPHHLIEFLGAHPPKDEGKQSLGTPPQVPKFQGLQQSSEPNNGNYIVFAGPNEVTPNSGEAYYVNFT